MPPVVAKPQGVTPEIVATVSASGEVLAVKRTATAKRRSTTKSAESVGQDPAESLLQPKLANPKTNTKPKAKAKAKTKPTASSKPAASTSGQEAATAADLEADADALLAESDLESSLELPAVEEASSSEEGDSIKDSKAAKVLSSIKVGPKGVYTEDSKIGRAHV